MNNDYEIINVDQE